MISAFIAAAFTFTASATGVEKGTPVEFLFVIPFTTAVQSRRQKFGQTVFSAFFIDPAGGHAYDQICQRQPMIFEKEKPMSCFELTVSGCRGRLIHYTFFSGFDELYRILFYDGCGIFGKICSAGPHDIVAGQGIQAGKIRVD